MESSSSSSFSSSCGTSDEAKVVAPMDLFDEHWFFSNTLNSKSAKNLNRCSSLPGNGNTNNLDATWNSIKSQRKNQEQEGLISMRKMLSTSILDSRLLRNSQQKKIGVADRIFYRALLRMTSMPSPHNLHDEFDLQDSRKNEGSIENMEKNSLNGHRMATTSLLRAPSLPAPEIREDGMVQDVRYHPQLRISRFQHVNSSVVNNNSYGSPKIARAMPITGRVLPPKYLKVDTLNESIYRKAFQEKKWKSYSDLEAMERQAFRDLGFDLDNEVSNLEMKTNNEDNEVSRPCLSESWFVQKSAPPVPKWVSKSSGVDMKEQIKFWARSVACNVREK